MGNLRSKYSDAEWEHLVRISKINGGENDLTKYADVPMNVYDAAVKHATNWGIMSYVFPEKKDNFIAGAMSDAAKEYWFEQFVKDRAKYLQPESKNMCSCGREEKADGENYCKECIKDNPFKCM